VPRGAGRRLEPEPEPEPLDWETAVRAEPKDWGCSIARIGTLAFSDQEFLGDLDPALEGIRNDLKRSVAMK